MGKSKFRKKPKTFELKMSGKKLLSIMTSKNKIKSLQSKPKLKKFLPEKFT